MSCGCHVTGYMFVFAQSFLVTGGWRRSIGQTERQLLEGTFQSASSELSCNISSGVVTACPDVSYISSKFTTY